MTYFHGDEAKKILFFLKKKFKMADLKKLSFSTSPKAEQFPPKFLGLVLGLVGLIDDEHECKSMLLFLHSFNQMIGKCLEEFTIESIFLFYFCSRTIVPCHLACQGPSLGKCDKTHKYGL